MVSYLPEVSHNYMIIVVLPSSLNNKMFFKEHLKRILFFKKMYYSYRKCA